MMEESLKYILGSTSQRYPSPPTLSPGATTSRAHEQWRPQASALWEMQEVQALNMLFKATFWN